LLIEKNRRRRAVAIGFVLAAAARSSLAFAQPPPVPASAPTPASVGLAVVAMAGATDSAWPLARSVYAAESLRPVSMDEPHARSLCGEAPPSNAPPDVRDLAELIASLHGDDAPSRALLGDIARRFSVRAVVVVRADGGRPSARVFLADAGAFDAATYTPDEASPLSWSEATRSLVRAFGWPPPDRIRNQDALVAGESARSLSGGTHAPSLATHEESGNRGQVRRREFYESGWFWGALGAAAFAGGAVFLATRDSGGSAIHLQVQVPH
jgi:hypothetical protein